ncbi:MAG TPA: hypothetical protein VE263_10405 [Candidatus Angelobacter sp.]|nr:hypothetical protein [Candidatus Angelobacter sp.]
MNTARAIALIGICLGAGIWTSPAANEATAKERAQASEEMVSLPSGATLFAELDSTVDSKKMKSGDAVAAHTTREMKANGKVILPRNTKLVGHVTQATAKSKGDPDSTLAIQFDKAVLKKGPEVPLKVAIQAIAAPERYAPGGGPEENTSNVGSAGSQTSPMGSSRPTMGGSAPATTMPGGAAGSGRDSDEEKSGTGSLTATSRGVTGINGLQLAAEGATSAGGSLIVGTGKSVHLDGGTRILLIVP